jgi:mannose-6-phosphate isomerase-like protein (cupin superfamily)
MDSFIAADDNPPSSTDVSIRERQRELAKNKKPTLFKLKAQLLEQGRTDTVLAATDTMSLRLKVYAEGGENEMHAHPHEDHFFVVMQGAAIFHGPGDETVVIKKNEGIMLPKGNLYWFVAQEGEPLVMLRVGSPNSTMQPEPDRINAKGEPMAGDSAENKTKPVKFKRGAWFGL